MAPPYKVRTLDEYLDWVDQEIDWAGGDAVLQADYIEAEDAQVVMIQQQLVSFAGDVVLYLALSIDSELNLISYSYHLQRGTAFVRRFDMHDGHRGVGGARDGLCHVHYPDADGGDTDIRPSEEVHIDDVLELIRQLTAH